MFHNIPTFPSEKMQSLIKLADVTAPNYPDRYRVWPVLPEAVVKVLYQLGALLVSNPLTYTQYVKNDISLYKLNEFFIEGKEITSLIESKAISPTKTQEADCIARILFCNSLPEVKAGNGSNIGKGYLSLYFILETALDHILPDDILMIHSMLKGWGQLVTVRTRSTVFPNGSLVTSDLVALQILTLYITNNVHRFQNKDKSSAVILDVDRVLPIDFCHPEVIKAVKKAFAKCRVPGLSDAKITDVLSLETQVGISKQVQPLNTVLSFLPLGTLAAAARSSKKLHEMVEQSDYKYIREGKLILDKNIDKVSKSLVVELKTRNGLVALAKGLIVFDDLKNIMPRLLEYYLSYYGMRILEKKLLPISLTENTMSSDISYFFTHYGVMALEKNLIPSGFICLKNSRELLELLIITDELQALEKGVLTVELAAKIPIPILKLLLPLLHKNLFTKEDLQEIILVPERDVLLKENKITLEENYSARLLSFLSSPKKIEELKNHPRKIRKALGLSTHPEVLHTPLPKVLFNTTLSYLSLQDKGVVARTSKALSVLVNEHSDYKAMRAGHMLYVSNKLKSNPLYLLKTPGLLMALGKKIISVDELQKLGRCSKHGLISCYVSDFGREILIKKLLPIDEAVTVTIHERLTPLFTKEGITVLENKLIPLDLIRKSDGLTFKIMELLIIKDKAQALQQKLITAELACKVSFYLEKILSLLHEKKLFPKDVEEVANLDWVQQLKKIEEIVKHNEVANNFEQSCAAEYSRFSL